jgi:hypothetical protein
LQNTGIEVVFNVGRTDAEYIAKELSRIDPLQVKHKVTDEYAVEKTHPVFYSLGEQWQGFTEYLQDLPPRHFALKLSRTESQSRQNPHATSASGGYPRTLRS